MIKKLMLGIGLCLIASLAQAEYVKRSMPACLTEDLLDELSGYSAKGDRDSAAQMLIRGQCTLLKSGEQISVISPGFMVATIRYRGIKLFTPSEAVR